MTENLLEDAVDLLTKEPATDEPRPRVQLTGRDGNAFAIIAACHRAARKAGWPNARWVAVRTAMMSGSYDELLATAMKHFNVR